jgi:hypothetical protein
MAENATEWFGMRVTPTQKEKIKRLAEREDTTQKAAVLNAVDRQLAGDSTEEDTPSALEQIADLVGVEPDSDAPTDLSTNPEHMADYGKD